MDVQDLYNIVLQLISNSKDGGELPVLETLGSNKSLIVFDPADGKLKTIPKSAITFTGEPPSKLTDLTDTPDTKLGQAGKILVVSEDEQTFEYQLLGEVTGVTQTELDAAIDEANAYAESLLGNSVSPTRIDSWVLGYDSGLTYNPTFHFTIDGVVYTDSRTITFDAADPSDARKDLFVINKNTQQIEKLTGTPGTNTEPDVDFSVYLKGPVVDIPAGATTPANINITTVWNENTGTGGGEWNISNPHADYDYDNTENPKTGMKAIKVVEELVVNQILGFAAGADIPVSEAKEFQFDIQNITTGGGFHITVIGKRSNGRTESLQLPAPTGFDPANVASYQTITLPIVTNQLVSIHEIRFITEVAGYKFYFDNARLIGGEGTTAPSGDYVTRTEFETLDSEVVKSVSVNGGTPVLPDGSGNVDLTVSGDGTASAPYLTMQALYDDQANQVTHKVYYVEDASTHSEITHNGWAAFQKKATSTSAEADYELREQQDFDTASGGVRSVTGSLVDNTDPLNPVINDPGSVESFNFQNLGYEPIIDTKVNEVAAIHALSPLTTPTYDGSGQTVHPSVIFIPEGFEGYKYFMAHTPYPNADDTKEWVSILGSNDRINWELPTGTPDPINGVGASGFEADPCIFKALDGSLNIIYPKSGMSLISTTDLVNWTSAVDIFEGNSPASCMSPSMVIIGNKYRIYYIDLPTRELRYVESTSLTSGYSTATPVTCTINNIPAGDQAWHIEIRKHYDEFHLLLNTDGSNEDLLFGKSLDGETFEVADSPLLQEEPNIPWVSNRLYKASFVLLNSNQYAIWYSGVSAANEWRVGYTEASLRKDIPVSTSQEAYEKDTNKKADNLYLTETKLYRGEFRINIDYEFAMSSETADLAASTTVPVYTDRIAEPFTSRKFYIKLGQQAPSGAGSNVEVDVKKNGTSIFDTKPTIDPGEFTIDTAAIPQVITGGSVTFLKGDLVEVFITNVGSANTGKGLKGKFI